MDKRNTIGRILNELEKQVPLVEEGDIVETMKTIYPSYKLSPNERNIELNGVVITPPLASSKENKLMLLKEKSLLLETFKDTERGDILLVKKIKPNKITVENLSIKEEYRKDFEIEKLDFIKGNFNIIKRKSIDLVKTLNRLLGNN